MYKYFLTEKLVRKTRFVVDEFPMQEYDNKQKKYVEISEKYDAIKSDLIKERKNMVSLDKLEWVKSAKFNKEIPVFEKITKILDSIKDKEETPEEIIEKAILKTEYSNMKKQYIRKMKGEVILETTEIANIQISGRNEAIELAEEAVGIKYPRELIWVDGAENTKGEIILPYTYDKVYVLKGTKEDPFIVWIEPYDYYTNNQRPYYKEIDGQTHIYVDGFSGGSGTQGDPYIISNRTDLEAIDTYPTAYHKLDRDIDVTTTTWDSLTDYPNGFSGELDGDGYIISNMTKIASGSNNGMFDHINGGTIKNLFFANLTMEGLDYVGGLCSYASNSAGVIDNCGILSGSITMQDTGQYGGTFFGELDEPTMTDCYSLATMESENTSSSNTITMGGMVGQNYGSITDCYYAGTYTSIEGLQRGGFCGNNSGTITTCYWNTTIGYATSSGGTGLTTAQMKVQSNFTGFDFTNTWYITSALNDGYPILQVERHDVSISAVIMEVTNAEILYTGITIEIGQNISAVIMEVTNAEINPPNIHFGQVIFTGYLDVSNVEILAPTVSTDVNALINAVLMLCTNSELIAPTITGDVFTDIEVIVPLITPTTEILTPTVVAGSNAYVNATLMQVIETDVFNPFIYTTDGEGIFSPPCAVTGEILAPTVSTGNDVEISAVFMDVDAELYQDVNMYFIKSINIVAERLRAFDSTIIAPSVSAIKFVTIIPNLIDISSGIEAPHISVNGFTSGEGIITAPYLISNVNELNNVRNHLDAYFRLANDIDATETASWTAIGGGALIDEDMETDLDTNIWIAEIADSSNMAYETDPLNASNRVVRLSVADDDPLVYGGRRAELSLLGSAYEEDLVGEEVIYEWNFMIPSSAVYYSDWEVIGQLHQQPDWDAGETWENAPWYIDSNPIFQFSHQPMNNTVSIWCKNARYSCEAWTYDLPLTRDVWHTLKFTANFQEDSTGYIKAWLDDTPFEFDPDTVIGASGTIVDRYTYKYPTLMNASGNIFKLGTYRNTASPIGTSIMYIDNISIATGGLGWTPIGSYENPFTGNFNGQGYAIDGIYIRRTALDTGFFNGMKGTVTRLGLTNVDIVGQDYTGAFSATLDTGADITECYVTGSVASGGLYCGGFTAGMYGDATVADSYSMVGITNNNLSVSNRHFGGFTGHMQSASVSLTRCYVAGTLEFANDTNAGVIVEQGTLGTVTDCFWNTTTTGIEQEYTGGQTETDFVNIDFENGIPSSYFPNIQTVGSDTVFVDTITDPVDSGNRVFRAYVGTANGSDRPRAEITDYNDDYSIPSYNDGSDYWYEWDMYIPTTASSNDELTILGQWHCQNDGGDRSFAVAFRLDWTDMHIWLASGEYCFTGSSWFWSGIGIRDDASNNYIIQKGKWYKMKLHVSWATTQSGWCEAYINDGTGDFALLKDTRIYGNTMFSSAGNYFKIGVYRYSTSSTGTTPVYYDNIRMYTSTGGGGSVPVYEGTDLTDSEFKNPSNFTNFNFTTTWTTNSAINNGYPILKNMHYSTSILAVLQTLSVQVITPTIDIPDINVNIVSVYMTGTIEIRPPTIHTNEFESGAGTLHDPFIIASINQLNNVRNHLDAYFELANDIDASETITWNGGLGFLPIGSWESPFTGDLDGNGYEISNLYMNNQTTSDVAIFSSLSNAHIYNLGIVDLTIYCQDFSGGITGTMINSIVEKCYTSGNIYTTSNAVGGIAGFIKESSLIENCYSHINIYEQVSGTVNRQLGGVVGIVNDATSTVNKCYATGFIDPNGGVQVGGLCGKNNGTVSDCYWDTQTSNLAISDGGTGKTTAEMQTQGTFTGWDFSGTWALYSEFNGGYPLLLVAHFDNEIISPFMDVNAELLTTVLLIDIPININAVALEVTTAEIIAPQVGASIVFDVLVMEFTNAEILPGTITSIYPINITSTLLEVTSEMLAPTITGYANTDAVVAEATLVEFPTPVVTVVTGIYPFKMLSNITMLNPSIFVESNISTTATLMEIANAELVPPAITARIPVTINAPVISTTIEIITPALYLEDNPVILPTSYEVTAEMLNPIISVVSNIRIESPVLTATVDVLEPAINLVRFINIDAPIMVAIDDIIPARIDLGTTTTATLMEVSNVELFTNIDINGNANVQATLIAPNTAMMYNNIYFIGSATVEATIIEVSLAEILSPTIDIATEIILPPFMNISAEILTPVISSSQVISVPNMIASTLVINPRIDYGTTTTATLMEVSNVELFTNINVSSAITITTPLIRPILITALNPEIVIPKLITIDALMEVSTEILEPSVTLGTTILNTLLESTTEVLVPEISMGTAFTVEVMEVITELLSDITIALGRDIVIDAVTIDITGEFLTIVVNKQIKLQIVCNEAVMSLLTEVR